MLYSIYEGAGFLNDRFYILSKEPIRRHRQRLNSERLRRKLPAMLLSGYSIICGENDNYCDVVLCKYKDNEEAVIEGCCKCGLFKVVVEDKYIEDKEEKGA
jgi:hypothetical protein